MAMAAGIPIVKDYVHERSRGMFVPLRHDPENAQVDSARRRR
jgi:hypothetical protein